jgi:hypothetical protein
LFAVQSDWYGCNGPLAGLLVITTYLASLLTIPLLIVAVG